MRRDPETGRWIEFSEQDRDDAGKQYYVFDRAALRDLRNQSTRHLREKSDEMLADRVLAAVADHDAPVIDPDDQVEHAERFEME